MLKPHKPEAMKEYGLKNVHIKRRNTKNYYGGTHLWKKTIYK